MCVSEVVRRNRGTIPRPVYSLSFGGTDQRALMNSLKTVLLA
jgi:hypothetical protein